MTYANEKIREIFYSMVNTTYNSTQDMIDKIQSLKGKKLKLHQNNSNYYKEVNYRRQNGNFQVEEDPVANKPEGIKKLYHEVLLWRAFLQTKPQVKSMNNKYYNLYYTAIKSRDDKEIVFVENENNENDFINYEDIIIPNHHVGIKTRGTI